MGRGDLTPRNGGAAWGRRGERRFDGPWGPLLGHRAACYGLAQPFEKPLQLGLAVFETPDPIGQLLDVVP